MKTKLSLQYIFVVVSGGVGLLLLTLGTFVCFVGLTGIVIIKAGEMLSSYFSVFWSAFYYGIVSMGAGIFAIGLGIKVRDVIRNNLVNDENLSSEQRSSVRNDFVLKYYMSTVCVGCKNYHGVFYGGTPLICAMHPSGPISDECSNWEPTSDL